MISRSIFSFIAYARLSASWPHQRSVAVSQACLAPVKQTATLLVIPDPSKDCPQCMNTDTQPPFSRLNPALHICYEYNLWQ